MKSLEKPTYKELQQTIARLEGEVHSHRQDIARFAKGHTRFQTILESAIHAIIIVNDHGLIVEWPSQAELLCGWSRDDIIGQPITTIMPIKHRLSHETSLPRVLSGKYGKMFGKKIETTILARNEFEVAVELAVSMTQIDDHREFNLFIQDITERKKHEAQLHKMSITDELTGLLNRRGFMAVADRQLKLAQRNKNDIFLLYVDFDNMKWINDTHGHPTGDSALIETGEILTTTFREVDIIGRVGGDEFIVMMTDHDNEQVGKTVMTRLAKRIAETNSQQNRKFKIMLSIGTVHYDHSEMCSIEDLMLKADKLMYENKRKKKISGQYSHI